MRALYSLGMDAKEKILIVEDERNTAAFLEAVLSSRGYEVLRTGSGETAVQMAASHMPDLILLDLGLPDIDGMEVLKRVREWSDAPVIVVSARDGEQDKVDALDGGANDYVTKPFGGEELLARIRAAIRIRKLSGAARTDVVFTNGGLTVDYEKRIVEVDGRRARLTPTEYKILVLLSQNAGKVLSHEVILQRLWGPYNGEQQMLRVNIANIRKKIEKNPASPEHILTETGVGYRLWTGEG